MSEHKYLTPEQRERIIWMADDPREIDPPCECERVDVDQVDATGCPLHCGSYETRVREFERELSLRGPAAIEMLDSDLDALRAELKAAQDTLTFLGTITPCQNCDGSGKNAHGDCCRIPGHARECQCVLCQWKTAYYRQRAELDRMRKALEEIAHEQRRTDPCDGIESDHDFVLRLFAIAERALDPQPAEPKQEAASRP